jgi:hypothetical protein
MTDELVMNKGEPSRLFFPLFLFAASILNAATPSYSHGTSEVILMSSGTIVAAADSKELSYLFLSDGSSVSDNKEVCKARRVGSVMAVAAGYVQIGDFNIFDEIATLHHEGDSVESLAARLRDTLPARLEPVVNLVDNASGKKLEKDLNGSDLLQIALLGNEGGAPALHIMSFGLIHNKENRLAVSMNEKRCPGDCRNGSVGFFLGVHDAIDEYLSKSPSLATNATIDNAMLLSGLEYASRPDIVGGRVSLFTVNSSGISVVQPGACSSGQMNPPSVPAMNTISASPTPSRPIIGELDRRIAAVPNIVCHETTARFSRRGAQTQSDSFDAEVSIAEDREIYSSIHRNGKAYNRISDMPGAWAEGELTTMMKITRDAIQNHSPQLISRVGAGGQQEVGVEFRVMAEENAWTLTVGKDRFPMTFDGTAWFSSDSGHLTEINWHSVGLQLPSRIGISQIAWSAVFEDTKVADDSFIVPVVATYNVKYEDRCQRSDWTEARFTDFRRFGASSSINYN